MTRPALALAAALLLVAVACSDGTETLKPPVTTATSAAGPSPIGESDDAGNPPAPSTTTSRTRSATQPSVGESAPPTMDLATPTTEVPTGVAVSGPAIPIRLRLERRVNDVATEGFSALAMEVLTDSRGWEQAGFAFAFDDRVYDYRVILAEPTEVDSLCHPYQTRGQFSCQIGPIVALNADRWRTAVEDWPGDLVDYRTMLVNHEVGHLLGQHHPAVKCGADGEAAAVMAQQSKGVETCRANPWPLEWEIACAEQHVEPLAPPYEPNVALTCGPDG